MFCFCLLALLCFFFAISYRHFPLWDCTDKENNPKCIVISEAKDQSHIESNEKHAVVNQEYMETIVLDGWESRGLGWLICP